MTDETPWLARLVTTLENLAAVSAVQIAYLKSIGTQGSADELALEFADVYTYLEPRLERLNVPASAVEALTQLDGRLEVMSGMEHSELWTPDALVTSEDWTDIRRLASRVLLDLRGITQLEGQDAEG